MALDDTQKATIRMYLGYSDPSLNASIHSEIEGAMTTVSAAGEVQIEGMLTLLATIDETLQESWTRQKVTQVEDIKLAGSDEIRALRAEGRRLCAAIAALLGVRPRGGYFAGGAGISGITLRG